MAAERTEPLNTPRTTPRFRIATLTDRGKVRDHNEDACFADADSGLVIVADGMGGAQAGEVASQAVIEVLPKMLERRLFCYEKPTGKIIRNALRENILGLSCHLREHSISQIGLSGMGTTLVLALFHRRWAYIAHMGDSRAYLFRARQLTQLTEDHTVVGLLLRSGEITPEEAKTHPARNHLARFVGMPSDIPPTVKTVSLRKDDRILLCTDGLTGMVSDSEIASLLVCRTDAQQACKSLVAAANQAGGRDNVTVAVVDWS